MTWSLNSSQQHHKRYPMAFHHSMANRFVLLASVRTIHSPNSNAIYDEEYRNLVQVSLIEGSSLALGQYSDAPFSLLSEQYPVGLVKAPTPMLLRISSDSSIQFRFRQPPHPSASVSHQPDTRHSTHIPLLLFGSIRFELQQ